MPNPASCALCDSAANFSPMADKNEFKCQRCGDYGISGTAESLLRDKRLENRGAVSGWVRRQNTMGLTPNITNYNVDQPRALTKPPFKERAERYLLAATAKSERLDRPFNPVTNDLIGISYSDDANDLAVILAFCGKKDSVKRSGSGRKAVDAQGIYCSR